MVLIPGSGISPRRRNRNPLQHSCLENPIDRGTWWACYSPWVHKSQIWLSTHTGYGEYGKKAIFSHLLIPILKLILSAPHENHVFFTACIIKKIDPDFPGGSDGKAFCLQWGRPRFEPWVGKTPWQRKWQSTPVLLPGKSHGQRSLVCYSPWGGKEVGTTERLHSITSIITPHFSNYIEFNHC